jgi:hypothetical protein
VRARATPLLLKATVQPSVVARLSATASEPSRFTSLALEIGPDETVLRGVLTQQPRPMALADAKHLLGDDFGLVNTCAWSVVLVDRPLEAAFFEEAAQWSKREAKTYLETHTHDGTAVMEVLHSGRNFLAAINRHALHVDALRKQIDLRYERFHRIKHEVCRILSLADDARLDFAMDCGLDQRLVRLMSKLQLLLKQIAKLKSLRRGVYRTVAGMKKSWFGWLSTQKVRLARQFQAACVREDLTILAHEKKSSDYMGRTMNKMLNNGSKGQYLRANSSKLKWNGIPELTVPSYYSSVTDHRHAVVDKKQRRGEDFIARIDGARFHADLHGSLTIALYPLLRKKAVLSPGASMDLAALAA